MAIDIRCGLLSLSIAGGVLVSGLAAAQQAFPNRPVHITVGQGGTGDVISRLLADKLTPALGQPVVVDNRVALISGETVARAAPDGHSLVFASNFYWLRPLMGPANFDGLRDFAPITQLTNQPSVVVVHPSVPVNSVKELIALAKDRPGALNFGSAGTGTLSHLAPVLFNSMAGVDITHVPYKQAAQSIGDLLAGRLQMMITIVPTVAPHIKAGKLKAIAVTTAEPYPGIDLPTVAASGLPGYSYDSINGLLTTAKTPPATINRLHDEFVRAINLPDVKAQITKSGADVVTSTPEALARKMQSDVAIWSKLFKELNIRVEEGE